MDERVTDFIEAQLARAMRPALVVPEDCDLVAEDRDLRPGAWRCWRPSTGSATTPTWPSC